MATLTTLTFAADGVGRFVSSAVQLNNRVASVAVALSAAGSISIERSLDSVNFSTVSEFSKSLSAAGRLEFGLSDAPQGQFIRIVTTVLPTSIKVLS
ncbi:hypothetical protein [Macellibacteroides fermentans]|uniref:Imidazoleglycerol phosphate dehydratase HisB n=1 Tax=Macellibacteroides fermentans TaxID=879969 RepID=A0A8E1ZV97_9PORP|nr:hypothetical protein [Macellibacteroides fermentans]NYI49054.1 imidazoleglycerol phosphate dehydratase HisB [Macellibacteroides fermentans]